MEEKNGQQQHCRIKFALLWYMVERWTEMAWSWVYSMNLGQETSTLCNLSERERRQSGDTTGGI